MRQVLLLGENNGNLCCLTTSSYAKAPLGMSLSHGGHDADLFLWSNEKNEKEIEGRGER